MIGSVPQRDQKRREGQGGVLCACLPACELTMASAASSDEPVKSDELVCLDLFNAAMYGKLDEVTRLAEEKGVVNKVTWTTVPVTRSCSSHPMCV